MSKQPSNPDPDLDLNAIADPELASFTLLSAYIDGEATPEESRQVQMLLDHDPAFKQQYLHLHQIRQGLQAMPTPQSQSHRQLSNSIFTRLRWKRRQVFSMWGGGAIAALFIAGVVSNIPRSGQVEQFANNPTLDVPTDVDTAFNPVGVDQEEAIMVALNRPVLQIPKLATSGDAP